MSAPVTLTLSREDAERLFDHLGDLPMHGAWSWSLAPWLVLGRALGKPMPAWATDALDASYLAEVAR